MRRLTSVFAHVLPAVAALGLLVSAPALAQTTPPPSRASVIPAPAMAPQPAPPRQGQQGRQGQQPIQAPQPGQGQQGQMTPPAAAPRPEPRAPYIGGANNQPVPAATNIRLDLTITDTYTGTPTKKIVSMLVLTGNNGMIRTDGSDGFSVLNVDAIAAAYTGGQVSIRMTFEYRPAQAKTEAGGVGQRAPRLNESITVVLQDGKPMVVSQSADPSSDRKVTAELTATILK